MNTYWRLLGFAKPIEKYAIPYFFYTLFYTIFYTFTFILFCQGDTAMTSR